VSPTQPAPLTAEALLEEFHEQPVAVLASHPAFDLTLHGQAVVYVDDGGLIDVYVGNPFAPFEIPQCELGDADADFCLDLAEVDLGLKGGRVEDRLKSGEPLLTICRMVERPYEGGRMMWHYCDFGEAASE
jgi:hypothetical protein